MTSLMAEPVDHWLDLDVQTPRKPLREEMFSAFDVAVEAPAGHRRAYWTGVGTGYAVAFGLVTREALEKARRIPGALPLTADDCWKPQDDEETAWACGVLYGYQQGTSELPDADECVTCGQRILTTVDDYEGCADGVFCPFDCKSTFHANGPSVCSIEGAE